MNRIKRTLKPVAKRLWALISSPLGFGFLFTAASLLTLNRYHAGLWGQTAVSIVIGSFAFLAVTFFRWANEIDKKRKEDDVADRKYNDYLSGEWQKARNEATELRQALRAATTFSIEDALKTMPLLDGKTHIGFLLAVLASRGVTVFEIDHLYEQTRRLNSQKKDIDALLDALLIRAPREAQEVKR